MTGDVASLSGIGSGEARQPTLSPWMRFREIVLIAATTEFRIRYAGSVLGYAWTLLRPLMLFAVLYVVFTRIIRFGEDVPAYPVLLLFNIVLFSYFGESTTQALRCYVARGPILRSVRVTPLALPVSAITAVALTFAGNLVVVIVWILAYGVEPSATWLFLPLMVLYLTALIAGLGLLLSTLYVHYRDIGHAWQPISRLLFYASPVIFPFELIPEGILRSIATLNPLSPLLVQGRVWIIDDEAPTWPELAGSTFATIVPFAVMGAICAAGVVAYLRARERIAERL